MYKTRSYYAYLMPSITVGLFSFVFFFFLVGCIKNATPIVEPPQTTLTETLLTPSENPKFTYTSGEGMTESAPHVSPYIKVTVESVQIRYLKTNPVQVELVIQGTLPDQCKYNFYSVENRGDQKVKVSLYGIHPSDNSCPQTSQSIEYVLPLGRDLPAVVRGFSPGDYDLTVNDYQTSFTIN